MDDPAEVFYLEGKNICRDRNAIVLENCCLFCFILSSLHPSPITIQSSLNVLIMSK